MATNSSATEIAKSIRAILENKDLNSRELIRQLGIALKDTHDLDKNLLDGINKRLKGPYGSEYLYIQGDFHPIIDFYIFLKKQFPTIPDILLTLADLYLLAKNYGQAFDTFIQAFKQEPLLVFRIPGELPQLLDKFGNESQIIEYRMALVKALALEGELDDAREEYQEIIRVYGKNNETVQQYLVHERSLEDLLPGIKTITTNG